MSSYCFRDNFGFTTISGFFFLVGRTEAMKTKGYQAQVKAVSGFEIAVASITCTKAQRAQRPNC